ncbi:DUF2252 domain-containing protein [Telmatobacter sp. DSM 110680]|uniref:DUF2252 domain-containing protein n=1 Tax=Telmatobacter sp. DSM 110680 TaxID=3036704 RepID=A0AAU7DMQ3_9BACT
MSWATPEERRNLGQSRRKQLGRQQNDQLNIKARKTTPLSLLQRAERGRVPALLKLKHRLMADSPFGYFRGAAPVMAADLAVVPNTGIEAQLCGDAHVRNLGAFAAPDGRLVFDINDFDETIRGPFEWDLKRMAASLVLAARESRHKEASARQAVEQCILRYSEQMRTFAKIPLLEVGRFQVHRLGDIQPVHQALLKAERATPLHTLAQLTEPTPGKPDSPRRFKEIQPFLWRIAGSKAEKVLEALGPYQEMLEPQRRHLLSLYRPIDVAFKVVGTGSVGLRDYCIYFEGNGPGDPLFLQIKEEAASAYSPYLPQAHPATQNGQRVVNGQRAMQVQSDPFLGWTNIGSRQFLVRQLNDHKGSIELADLAGSGLMAFGEVCGELLARGHARSGDPLVITGYLGNGQTVAESLARFGTLYADQTEKDWQALRRSGQVEIK